MRWFVMVRNYYGKPMALCEPDDDGMPSNVAMTFDSERDAEDTAEKTLLGEAYGYEVYEWPD